MDNQEIKEELTGIREELKALAEVIMEYKLLEQKLISSNQKHDEGRKVLHKRLDLFAKVAFWFGTTLFTGMTAVIWTLVDKVLK